MYLNKINNQYSNIDYFVNFLLYKLIQNDTYNFYISIDNHKINYIEIHKKLCKLCNKIYKLINIL